MVVPPPPPVVPPLPPQPSFTDTAPVLWVRANVPVIWAPLPPVPPDPELVFPPPPPAPLRVTVAETVPAGGVAVTKLEQLGPLPLQLAATGLVAAPATPGVSATTANIPPTMATTTAQVPMRVTR